MEDEIDFESLCTQCGLCCHAKIGLLDGTSLIHPRVICKYQNEKSGICIIYNERFKINPKCNSLKQIMERDGILPEGCPFIKLRPGYKVARVVSEGEFNRLTLEDLLKGNYNLVKLLDDIAADPTTMYKIISLDEE
jgi:uncharacterized cysteine cluster protein YcgN (CxxCxxCC family)